MVGFIYEFIVLDFVILLDTDQIRAVFYLSHGIQ